MTHMADILRHVEPDFMVGREQETGKSVFIIARMPKDPALIGILLADAARHYANAYEEEGYDRDEALMEIWSIFQKEMIRPTDTVEMVTEGRQGAITDDHALMGAKVVDE